MNQKQFGILLALVVVLGGAGLWIHNQRGQTWTGNGQSSGQKLLGDFQVNDVAHIVIKRVAEEINLAKTGDLWRVKERGDYPANFSEIVSLLTKLKGLKVVQTEQVGPSQLKRFELEAPGQGSNTATLVELHDSSGKAIKSLLLGKKHMQKSSRASQFGDMDEGGWPDGRYVMADAKSGNVALISDALNDIEPKAEHWLNKDFFKIEKARSLAVTFPEATNSWQLTRESETAEWKLSNAKPAEKLDAGKISAMANPFSSPTINDVSVGLSAAQTGLDKPMTVKIGTTDGFDYMVNVGAKTNDDYFLTVAVAANLAKERTPGKDEKPEDKTKLDKEFADNLKKLEEKLASEKAFEKWTFLVSSWTVDPFLRKRAELLEENKPEAAANAAMPEEKPVEPKPESN
jgi:hypothetical protein